MHSETIFLGRVDNHTAVYILHGGGAEENNLYMYVNCCGFKTKGYISCAYTQPKIQYLFNDVHVNLHDIVLESKYQLMYILRCPSKAASRTSPCSLL